LVADSFKPCQGRVDLNAAFGARLAASAFLPQLSHVDRKLFLDEDATHLEVSQLFLRVLLGFLGIAKDFPSIAPRKSQ
jgi:hypothetical protein